MGNLKYKLTEKVEFIEPRSEKEAQEKKEGWAEGIVYVDDERIPPEFLKKIEAKYGPISKGSYFTNNFSTYWEKLAPDYKGEVDKGYISVSNSYQLPNFAKIFKGFTEMNDNIEFISRNKDVKNDNNIQAIFKEFRDIFNKYRTHLRKTYPAEYELILKSGGLLGKLGGGIEEMSTTGGGAGAATFTPGTGAQYATPFAFRKKGKKADDKAYKELGFKQVKENKNPGATLGPGPKASEDGVKDNYYVKNFKYKLVPKNKKGTYVQKGSGLEVKNLFEGTTDDFQKKRISAFDDIEQELNHIYKMISNAKNETAEYYKENPGSYNVVKPTDLVKDYLTDIKKLLKGEE